jgi:uncharacterized protein (TIGR02466 family)
MQKLLSEDNMIPKMCQFVFGVPIFKYHLDSKDIKVIAEKKFEVFGEYPINETPNGWDCNIRTEFHSSDDNRYAHLYKEVMDEFTLDLGLLEDKCHIDESWLNFYQGKDHGQEEHDHLPGFFSGIHYVKFNPDVHASTKFANPLHQLYNLMNNRRKMDENNPCPCAGYGSGWFSPNVCEGDIIIFPSFLRHWVPSTNSNELRITLAFNINTTKGSNRRVFGR